MMDNKNEIIDITDKELIDMKQIAQILGLKYHTARKIIFNDYTLHFVHFGKRKRLWLKNEILAFKQKHLYKQVMI